MYLKKFRIMHEKKKPKEKERKKKKKGNMENMDKKRKGGGGVMISPTNLEWSRPLAHNTVLIS
jgi:hypothetical protein